MTAGSFETNDTRVEIIKIYPRDSRVDVVEVRTSFLPKFSLSHVPRLSPSRSLAEHSFWDINFYPFYARREPARVVDGVEGAGEEEQQARAGSAGRSLPNDPSVPRSARSLVPLFFTRSRKELPKEKASTKCLVKWWKSLIFFVFI